MIADGSLDARRQSLLELAISKRHRKHSLWLLTQSYTGLPKNLSIQEKELFLWCPHERSDIKLIYEETNMSSDWKNIKTQLINSKHACLYGTGAP